MMLPPRAAMVEYALTRGANVPRVASQPGSS